MQWSLLSVGLIQAGVIDNSATEEFRNGCLPVKHCELKLEDCSGKQFRAYQYMDKFLCCTLDNGWDQDKEVFDWHSIKEAAGLEANANAPEGRSTEDCCLFAFLDGSIAHLNDFHRKYVGGFRLQPGKVNGSPHYVSRKCENPSSYSEFCFYLWKRPTGRWVIGPGQYVGKNHGYYMHTDTRSDCPHDLEGWKFYDGRVQKWRADGKVTFVCE